MKTTFLFFCTLLLSCVSFANETVPDQPRPLSYYSGELISQVKLAKEYYMTSTDPAAGNTFEERTANLSKKIKSLFETFKQTRTQEYRTLSFQFKGSDWATGKHTPKTVTIPANTYIFSKIVRTTNGDWKGGPVINGVNRASWFEGDIPGGSVRWVTGGHGKAKTNWTITARYSDSYITSLTANDTTALKNMLNAQGLPSE